MNDGPSRRSMLAALGTSIALAGCTESIDGDAGDDDGDEDDTGDEETPTEEETPEDEGDESDDGNGNEPEEDDAGDDDEDEDDETGEDDEADDDADDDGDDNEADDEDDDEEPELPRWPAIETGEVISEFGSDSEWTIASGTPMPRPDEARAGREALELESEGDSAVMAMGFPDGLDLEGWDLSMAIKAESAELVAMEVIAPERGDHLTARRIVPEGLDDWFRVDFGYTEKHGDPDLSNVTQLRLTVFGPEGGPTRFLADDLRRTRSADNGKAILTFYGGIDSHRSVAAPLLAEREWPAALPIDPRTIGDGGRMDMGELAQLRDRGWDICSYPAHAGALPDRPVEQQRDVIESSRDFLAEQGFEDGARHFFAPDGRLGRETVEIVRDAHESGFLFGSCPNAAPPTGIHTVSQIWGMELHDGVRRQINLADQYDQLTVIRVPQIVEDDAAEDASGEFMPVSDFEHLINHIEHRGLDVITPSELLDGDMAREGEGTEETPEEFELEEGTVLEAGEFHEFSGSGDGSTGSFDLQSGIAVASFDHDGSGEFVVRAEGDLPNDLVVSTAGSTLGESVVAVAGGSYSLAVEADGEWSIEVEQPEVHSDDVEALPVEASGTGSSFVGPLWTEGDVSLTTTHDGSGEFIIDGYDADGDWEQIVYDEGEFDSNRSYSAGGVVWLNVEADGDWTIAVE